MFAIVWPIFLGAGWKLNINPIMWGKILQIWLSLGSVALIYFIGANVYNKKTGKLAALFLGLSPSWFFWGNTILTDIPAVFFGLLAVYLYLNNKHSLSGWIGTLAFLTKFTQFITLVVLLSSELIKNVQLYRLKIGKNFFKLILGCLVLGAMYLILNLILYKDMFVPFTDAKIIYARDSAPWSKGILLCIKMIVKFESWALIFIPISVAYSFRGDGVKQKIIIIAIGFLQFVWVGKMPTDLSRFFISCLPYFYLLSADGIMKTYDFLKKYITFFSSLLIILITLHIGIQLRRITTIRFQENKLTIFQQYLLAKRNEIKGVIWISNPTTLVFSNLKAEERMYYPVFNMKKIESLRSNLHKPDFIFIDSNELRCRSSEDLACQSVKGKLFEEIKQNFKVEFFRVSPKGGRFLGIFKRKTG